VQLFPERDDRLGRRLLFAALIVSVLLHAVGGGTWQWYVHRVAPALAKLLPRPSPTPEIVALSDAITIERRTVPRPSRRAPQPRPAQPRPRPRQPAPRALAQLRPPQVPTLVPIPTAAPTVAATTPPTSVPATEPAYRPRHGTIHHAPPATPLPREVPTIAPPTAKTPLSAQQIAALDARFSKTIAQAQRSLSDVPPQRRPAARNPQQLRFEAIMAGTPEMFFAAAQGDCVPLQGPMRLGAQRAYYIRCLIRYGDGYFEEVSYPWIYAFRPNQDPFDNRVNPDGTMIFGPQGPSPGFVLPPNFALSRAVCTFYRAQCASLIARERAAGNQPAPAAP
jgi:hypothetical protein